MRWRYSKPIAALATREIASLVPRHPSEEVSPSGVVNPGGYMTRDDLRLAEKEGKL